MKESMEAKKQTVSLFSILASFIGVAIFGGVYVEAIGLVLAVIGWRRGEKNARKALLFSVACMAFTMFLAPLLLPFWGS